jgi:hypothetical protein
VARSQPSLVRQLHLNRLMKRADRVASLEEAKYPIKISWEAANLRVRPHWATEGNATHSFLAPAFRERLHRGFDSSFVATRWSALKSTTNTAPAHW